ncbi:MAG: ribosome biogenesis GTPase Der [Hyphomicrobiaceae bacterium]|nr:ribosome biogenesis GTPase Der [Hyphomicrobiaceae bacterium]
MPNKLTIAIVGRPNVGKSTLFNRLLGRRAALVSDMPGLTRDRREGTCEIIGHSLRLIDTAGLEEADPGSIPARMREQTELAIAEADVVLFVIDARAGVTPADSQFASIVRRSGHPTILVANKCEGRQGSDGFYEAFELGLGEPVAISAEHNEGVGGLELDILAALGLKPATKTSGNRRARMRAAAEAQAAGQSDDDQVAADDDEAPDRAIRVAIVGRPNAGKSTLVNALLGEDRMITGPEPGLTRDSIASDISWQGREFSVYDTAGLRKKARINEVAEKLSASDSVRSIRFAEVVVLLIDAERGLEHQDLTIGQMTTEEGRALVIAINKWDTVTDKQARLKALREDIGDKLAQVPGVPIVTISALAERGLDKLMAAVATAYEVWNRRVSTADLNRWLQEAVERHQPPAVSGRRIRLRYMTQPSTRPPTFIAFCSQPKGLPASYLRYLTNGLRETFDLPGTPIRFTLRKGANPYAK